MSIMNTVVAVALGLVPVNADGTVPVVGASETREISRLSQSVDVKGTTRLKGYTRTHSKRFDLAVAPDGRVQGIVGDYDISFRFRTLD